MLAEHPAKHSTFRSSDFPFRKVSQLIFFALLCGFTLFTWDGDQLVPLIVSAAVLFLAAFSFSRQRATHFRLSLPAVCLLAMTGYGFIQTLFFPHKIVAQGWLGVLFWLTAAAITLLAGDLFRTAREAARFRWMFILFGTLVCLLDLLQQASQTNRYFWLAASRYGSISGPFAYWNNFAEFVEIVLPVTLWRGLTTHRSGIPYLVCAAIQIGAVVASGSRAGAVLVVLELVTVIGFAYSRSRNRALLVGAALAFSLTAIFVYAAGSETLIAKLQQNDQLAVRRNIDRSSLAMIHTHPWSGWGLETYVPVYRMFARYDDGTYVNRAHNDWLEWAATGGIFFAATMLVVFIWSIRPAIRSGWALGLIAVCLHALVDYPFARFGVCGWYFCLLGILSAPHLKLRERVASHRDLSRAGLRLRPASSET